MAQRTQRFRPIAALMVVAWALAFLLLPGLHLVGHRADHRHLTDGTAVPNPTEARSVPDHPHQHGHVHPHPESSEDHSAPASDDRPAREGGPLDHGAGLGHFGVAALWAVAVSGAPLNLPRVTQAPAVPERAPFERRLDLTPRSSRGPPT